MKYYLTGLIILIIIPDSKNLIAGNKYETYLST